MVAKDSAVQRCCYEFLSKTLFNFLRKTQIDSSGKGIYGYDINLILLNDFTDRNSLDVDVVCVYTFRQEGARGGGGGGGAQLPNCQTQCRFSWLVVSPLRQKKYSEWQFGTCRDFMPSQPPPYPPLGPLTTSISALRTGAAPQASTWWTWAPAAHSLLVPSSDSTKPSVF